MKPIINCHTHVFKSTHIPPYIGKTFLPLGLYRLLNIGVIVGIFRWWFNGPYRWQFKTWYKKLQVLHNNINRNFFLRSIKLLFAFYLTAHAFFSLYELLSAATGIEPGFLKKIYDFIVRYPALYTPSLALKLIIIVAVMLFIPTGRNLILFILKLPFKFLSYLPGKQTKAYLARYLNIGRFAFYDDQQDIFDKLKDQYPKGSAFVVLPMDMKYMDAGPVRDDLYQQMEELAAIKAKLAYKDVIYPFVFVDPRRIEEDPDYFKYRIASDGTVNLEPCFIQTYIEQKHFSGFKIYPALGYYPFDKKLLVLWKYAADNELPVLTHCIRGTIFYRGKKKDEWNNHPVFNQIMNANSDDKVIKLLLPDMANADFCNNFTHPLNYLCILKEELLRMLVADSDDKDIHLAFGYTNPTTPLQRNLSHFKLCFGHFGGDDEWAKYLERDRDQYSPQLLKLDEGINFLRNSEGVFSDAKLEQLWKSTDWYSIICSIILQHPQVYADISYIVHSPDILSLLNRTLIEEKRKLPTGKPLRDRVLFGTDFYVVRNHKSEKHMLADMLNELSEEEFDLIARKNPREFLHNKLHGEVPVEK